MNDFKLAVREFLGSNDLLASCERVLAVMLVSLESEEIIGVSPLAAELFGYYTEELLYNRIDVLIPEEYRERHHDLVKAYRVSPITKQMGDSRINCLHKDGTVFSSSIWLIPDDDNVLLVFFK